ncbi:MAG: DNA-methyltransferase [Planctomycetota bacterium]
MDILQTVDGDGPPERLYGTDSGACFVGDSHDLMRYVPDDSVDLLLTSPPFALTRKKEYGNKDADEYVDWFLTFVPGIKRILKEQGSFVVDLGGAYLPGVPVRTIYQFDLLVRLCKEHGFFLAQEFFHYNPAKLPSPAEWVNVRRIRVKDAVNVVWWLSLCEEPKANNRSVLKPYSDSMKNLLKNGYRAKLRPSGHDISDNFSKENKGAIPPNLLSLPNTRSNTQYLRRCREEDIRPHPARFPEEFPQFFIDFLTEPGDLVLDIFAGSNTTGAVAERSTRRWLAFERDRAYAEASVFRFEVPGGLFEGVDSGAQQG